MKKSKLKKIILEVLNENPDTSTEGKYSDSDTITFYVYHNKPLIAYDNLKRKKGMGYIHGSNFINFYLLVNKFLPESMRREGDDFPSWQETSDRSIIMGRIFCGSGTISFWKYPESQAELNDIIRKISDEFNKMKKFVPPVPGINANVKYIEVPKYWYNEVDNFIYVPTIEGKTLILNTEDYGDYLEK